MSGEALVGQGGKEGNSFRGLAAVYVDYVSGGVINRRRKIIGGIGIIFHGSRNVL